MKYSFEISRDIAGCDCCPCYRDGILDECLVLGRGVEREDAEMLDGKPKRPDWCPLREVLE